jgi:thiol-disulfide isomerase/thioredoxin
VTPVRRWRRFTLELLAFVGLIALLTLWQARHLVAGGEPAPPLAVQGFDLSTLSGRRALVYFYAPWCGVCKLSAGNLATLRRFFDESELAIVAVALDYETPEEAAAFATEHGLPAAPVLGDAAVARDWRVSGYPTYYVVDAAGRVSGATYGYSSLAGLLVRTWLAQAAP